VRFSACLSLLLLVRPFDSALSTSQVLNTVLLALEDSGARNAARQIATAEGQSFVFKRRAGHSGSLWLTQDPEV
jgi:hypothetical protein